MEIQIEAISGKPIVKLEGISEAVTIENVKEQIYKLGKGPWVGRQELRLARKGKALKNEDKLTSTGWKLGNNLYLKDLGPQMNWTTVFMCEYIGPIVVYFLIYTRPWILYGPDTASKPYSTVTNLAAILWISHFAKRIIETIFVHRFSHATMPIKNLFKNCSHYWGFGSLISYYVSHPSYQAPPSTQVLIAAGFFLLFEYGNISIHSLLSGLRPPGSKVRKIPYPNSNPMTLAYNLVSCPHYLYETGIWAAFTIMTNSVPAFLFTLASLYQMSVWALAKHSAYRKEFPTYPKERTAILPYIL